jgi:hypothetical protein
MLQLLHPLTIRTLVAGFSGWAVVAVGELALKAQLDLWDPRVLLVLLVARFILVRAFPILVLV